MVYNNHMKSVAIVGGSDGYKKLPYDKLKDTEIWGLNDFAFKLDRVDKIFELHTNEVIKKNSRTLDYFQLLKNTKTPIYMQKKTKTFPSSVKYPLDEIVAKYNKVFYSTVDYMLALAVYEGFEKMYLYGVDLAIYEEYLYQRPSCAYWIGYARGLGIEVIIQEESGIYLNNMYAYNNSKEQALVGLLEQVYQLKRDIANVDKDISFTDGLLTAVENIMLYKNTNPQYAMEQGAVQRMMVVKEKIRLEKMLEHLLIKISDVTGHSVIIPERQIEIKK